jgi:hypothetical protein
MIKQLSLLSLWCIKPDTILKTLVLFCLLAMVSCKKDTILQPEPEPIIKDITIPRIHFIFVNRTGYKNDSTGLKWLSSVNLYCKFYNPKTNTTNLYQTIYNRNDNDFRLSDSIYYRSYVSDKGSAYAFEISVLWRSSLGTQFGREIRFATKNWPNAAETITNPKDTIIKFIYPDDTLPNNRFVRFK